jgi:hypothetical protein
MLKDKVAKNIDDLKRNARNVRDASYQKAYGKQIEHIREVEERTMCNYARMVCPFKHHNCEHCRYKK